MTTPHNCAEGHAHGKREGDRRRLAIVLVLTLGYAVAEVVGGLVSGSLALLADAGHMGSDVAALGLALFAAWLAARPPTAERTYGYYRAEVLAALLNAAALLAVSAYIAVEAYHRVRHPPEVRGPVLLGVAVGGLAVNLVGLWVLGGHGHGLNARGAWLHVLTDALGSVGAIAAGILVWAFAWHWADPVASVLICALVVYSAWGLLAESVAVLMEGAPREVRSGEVAAAMAAVPGVVSVHDLHVWTLTAGVHALTAHAVIAGGRDYADVLRQLRELVRERFGIDHSTIQVEPEEFEEYATTF